jgi:23S rRNA G2445 N2-methylase RlmL
MAYTPFFALTTRGLEFVSAQEIAASGAMVTETAYRRVAGHIVDSPDRLLNLRTVDDVYMTLASWDDIGHQRSMLAVFTWQARQLELADAVDTLRRIRQIGDPVVFSVTASFVGKRNYSADEIKQAIADGIQDRYDWIYTSDDREADLNLRLFIEHHMAYVGVRLASHPLHERDYKTAQIAGSLKPSVAAALVLLADKKPGAELLDPFCGAGTILAEAMHLGYDAVGGDRSLEALAASQVNIPDGTFVCWDAGGLPLRAEKFDAIATNLPWDRQIAVDDSLSALYRRAMSEIRRVIKPEGTAVLLTSTPDSLVHEGFTSIRQFEISLFGQTPTVTVMKVE